MSDHPLSILGDQPIRPADGAASPRALPHLGGDRHAVSPSDVEALLGRVRQRVAHVMARCASVDVFVAAQLGFASTTEDVEAVYADLQLFCRWHGDDLSTLGDTGQLRERASVCGRLIESEALLANQVNQWLLFLQSREGADSALRLFLSQVAAWHAQVKRRLREIAVELELEASRAASDGGAGEATPRADAGALPELADRLIDAGELETLSSFVEWTAGDRSRLLRFLGDESYPRRRELFERLWGLSDLLLVEDSASPPLLDALGRDREFGARFRELASWLGEDAPSLDADAVDRRFAPVLGVDSLLDADRSMLWRTVILGHAGRRVQEQAAEIVPLDDLWPVLVYPGSPATGIWAVAREVSRRGDEDLQKVFFDCVKSRLMSALGQVRGVEDLTVLGDFIALFFRFSFFIQTRYFEQLETLLHLFQAQSSRFGASAAKLGRDLHRLEIERHRAGSPQATDPRALDRLPLPVQRHLAREGCYLTFFACHPNHLIAREVVHYIHADNLSRFLKLPELNRQMLEEAMRRVDLGGKKELVVEVLTHSKCPMLFAGKHLPRLGRYELHRIVQSRSTHSEVKRKAMLHMIRLRGDERQPSI
ncbi:MAG: hypothetical protein AAGF23_15265 [Acidobacteriota bacterium]